jgi:hypothetical protein
MEEITEPKLCTYCNQSKPAKDFNYYRTQVSRRCKTCFLLNSQKIQKKARQRSTANKNLINVIASSLLRKAKERIIKRKAGRVTLTTKWVADILRIGHCQGSFPPLRFVLDKPGSPFSPSLDRIDSSNYNYTFENTRVTCVSINKARNNYDDKDTLLISESLSGFIKRRRNSI